MRSDTSHVHCSTHDGFTKRFTELDPFHSTKNADVIAEINERFSAMARTYALRADHLRNWVGNGNRLPEVYR